MGFYNSAEGVGVAPKIELAILIEDILLPELPPFPTMQEIHSGEVYYPRTIELYEDMIGKFSVPILFPLGNNTGDPEEQDMFSEPRNIISDSNLMTNPYQKSNYIELTIPKYIIMNFIDIIPKNTKFIICFIGESLDIEDIKIIGVSERYGGE